MEIIDRSYSNINALIYGLADNYMELQIYYALEKCTTLEDIWNDANNYILWKNKQQDK